MITIERRQADADLTGLAIAIRWGTLSLAVLGALTAPFPAHDIGLVTALVLYASLRTVCRPAAGPAWANLAHLCGEALLDLLVIALSGGWNSPFLLPLGATLVIAGLEGGVIAVGSVATLVLGAVAVVSAGGARSLAGTIAVQRVGTLAVVGAVGVYARRVLGTSDRHHGEEVKRLRAAHEVNSLLLELYSRVAGGPVTLSLHVALTSTVKRLREVLTPDVLVLLLAGTEGGPWQAAVSEGVALPATSPFSGLPAPVVEAAGVRGPVVRSDLAPAEGLAAGSRSGIYASLWSGDRLIGVLAVERYGDGPSFSAEDAEVAAEVARHGALAIDNARWFGRLRMVGAAAERGRIARELHDRVGQSLAGTAFSMRSLAVRAAAEPGAPEWLAGELEELATDLQRATRGVREELTDLRADTSDRVDLAHALDDLLGRVHARSGVTTDLVVDAPDRLPPALEHEVWRIAQEAVLNAERHSGADRIQVRWRRRGGRSFLEVCDDGAGFDMSAARSDAYGLVGMRERADAIGAQLVVAAPAGEGTSVRLRLVEA